MFKAKSGNLTAEKKTGSVSKATKVIKNWYADRYNILVMQRNVLLLFSVISAVGILVSLVVIKMLYEEKSIDPYLIEIDRRTNEMSLVESESKKDYTAQEVIKEYFINLYLVAREGYDESSAAESSDKVRVFSSPDIYEVFLQNAPNSKADVLSIGRSPTATIKIGSINYFAANRAQVTFTKEIQSLADNRMISKNYEVLIGFDFMDIDMSIADRRINPLGFQVTSYILQEKKVFNG